MDLTFLTCKDVMFHTGLGKTQAYELISDIKGEYKLKTKITMEHLLRYLSLYDTKDMPKQS